MSSLPFVADYFLFAWVQTRHINARKTFKTETQLLSNFPETSLSVILPCFATSCTRMCNCIYILFNPEIVKKNPVFLFFSLSFEHKAYSVAIVARSGILSDAV